MRAPEEEEKAALQPGPAAGDDKARDHRVLLHIVLVLRFVESFSYFTLNNVFTLHLTDVLGISDAAAGTLFGLRGALVRRRALLWLACLALGRRRCRAAVLRVLQRLARRGHLGEGIGREGLLDRACGGGGGGGSLGGGVTADHGRPASENAGPNL